MQRTDFPSKLVVYLSALKLTFCLYIFFLGCYDRFFQVQTISVYLFVNLYVLTQSAEHYVFISSVMRLLAVPVNLKNT